MRLAGAIRRFSPGVPHYLFGGVFFLRLVSLERLSRSALFLPVRGDMHFYNEWALRILHGETDPQHAFYGLPLYPYALSLIYRLFGYGPFVPGLIQALLDAGTGVLIYLITVSLLSGRMNQLPGDVAAINEPSREAKIFGVIATMGWTFFVPAQAYAIVLMPAAWFTFVFWLVVWRVVRSSDPPSWKECVLLGFLIGFAAMAVATALFLVPLILLAIFLRQTPKLIGTVAPKVAAVLIGIVVGTSPCWIHNFLLARDPVFLSAHGGVNFWIGNNPIANGYPRFPPGLRAGQAAMLEDSITSAESALGRPLKRAEVAEYWSGKARDYITRHPIEWLRLLSTKARNFCNAFQYDDLSIITNLREQNVIFPGIYFGLVAIFGLPGIVFAWRLAPMSRWIVLAIALLAAALMTVFITERYRLAAVPGLIVLGVFGVAVFWRALVAAQYVHATVYLTLIIAASLFVAWPQRDPALWALDAYNSGWQALESQNLSLAEQKLNLARRYVPTNPETNFALGNLHLAKGDKPGAASFYLATLQYEETHRGALNNLAVIALEEHRYNLAEDWLRRAASIEPDNAKTHFLLATALFAQGSRDAASVEIDTAVRLRPEQAEFARLKERIAGNPP